MRKAVLSLVVLLAACAPPATTVADPLAGVYRIGGGDSSLEIVTALTGAFSAKHTGIKFTIDSTLGSDPAVKLAANGTLDLGMVSRELRTDEKGLVDTTVIGVRATALAVHAENPVRTVTVGQALDLYRGTFADWSSVGGEKVAVRPLVREPGSSARATFENVVFGGKPSYAPTVLEIHGGDQMRQAIAAYRGAIGIIGVSRDDPEAQGVRILAVDGIIPTRAALLDGTYKLNRPLFLVARRGGTPKPAIASFLDFIKSAEGQKILQKF
ncbi:MAG: substrate-binding domain-containing protein [Chloroflexota bacterium]